MSVSELFMAGSAFAFTATQFVPVIARYVVARSDSATTTVQNDR